MPVTGHTNINDMNNIENIFSLYTEFSKKHKLNTCNKSVPVETLTKIENGCTLEELESLIGKSFPIYKYRTQITIHGVFPELTTNRVGGYVNLVQNQNLSVGVKYSAIDYSKKKRLFDMLQVVSGYFVQHNSQRFSVYKLEYLPNNWRENKEQIKAIVDKYKDFADKINKDLFFGGVSCYIGSDGFRYFVVLDIDIKCFYEKNFRALFENLSGLSFEVGEQRYKEFIDKKNKEREARARAFDEEMKARQKEREARKATLEQRKNEAIAKLQQNELKNWVLVQDYTPQNNDVIAFLHVNFEYAIKLKFVCFSKAFGKVYAHPCDINGKKDTFKRGVTAAKKYDLVFVKK